jgi:hypothetical protein
MSEEKSQLSLVDLPDPCLLAVLRCCAADDRVSLCSAARSHSRLHQAAVAALSTIDIDMAERQHVSSALCYMRKHGQHIREFTLRLRDRHTGNLRQLPSQQQLSSLQLAGLRLQLLPGNGFPGVLGLQGGVKARPLKELTLYDCVLVDGAEGLAAALLLLPGLEELYLGSLRGRALDDSVCCFTSGMLQLPNLTCLSLFGNLVQPIAGQCDLQPLQGLPRLLELRLDCAESGSYRVTAAMLSGVNELTCLDLYGVVFEPAALAGKSKLQELMLAQHPDAVPASTAVGVQLLSQLQHLMLLTSLKIEDMLHVEEANPPAAAFSALTASSKLQHLHLDKCTLPAGLWQHMFPTGRQLPSLQELTLCYCEEQPSGQSAPGPEGRHLVSACPDLQQLQISGWQLSTELLTALQQLSRLQLLYYDVEDCAEGWKGLEAVAQLTNMKEFGVVSNSSIVEASLLHLTQLKLLTSLLVEVNSPTCDGHQAIEMYAKVGSKP